MMPEMYWIKLGARVIGQDVLRDGQNARQAMTYQAIANWIMAHDEGQILDIGCNVGALALFLAEAGYEVEDAYIGIDANPHAIGVARERGLNCWVETIRDLSYDDGYFETVIVKDVIEHLEGPELLAEAFRVSWKYVIVATYIPWTNQPAEIVKHPEGYFTNRYDYRDVVKLAEGWGFRLSEMDTPIESNGTENQVWYFERKAAGT